MGPTMFSIMAVLIGSSYIEWVAVNKLPWLASLYIHGLGPIPGKIINFACSIALSNVLATVLGGGGSAAFIGGLGSTVVVAMLMSTKEQFNAHGVTWDKTKNQMSTVGGEVGEWFAANKHHFINFGKFLMFWIRLISTIVMAVIGAITLIVKGMDKAQGVADRARSRLA